MKAHFSYLKGLLLHKYWVFVYALKLGVPFYLAIIHDISKFAPIEWFAYVENFYESDGAKRSVRDKSGAYDTNKQSDSFKRAWIHHQRNKHHWQAWCNIGDGGVVTPIDIPDVYIREMIADWCGAGKSYSGTATPRLWYEKNKSTMVLTRKASSRIEEILMEIDDDL